MKPEIQQIVPAQAGFEICIEFETQSDNSKEMFNCKLIAPVIAWALVDNQIRACFVDKTCGVFIEGSNELKKSLGNIEYTVSYRMNGKAPGQYIAKPKEDDEGEGESVTDAGDTPLLRMFEGLKIK